MSRFSQSLFSSIKKTKTTFASLSRYLALFNILLFVLCSSLAVTYVVQVNRSATVGYHLRDLDKEISQLELANQQMQTKISEIRSMENVAAKVPMLGMVEAVTPTYLPGYASTVSMNR